MSLEISKSQPYCSYKGFGRTSSVGESIESRLVKFEQLTHAKAIEILRDIKCQADLASFFLKPIVNVPLTLASSVALYALAWNLNNIVIATLCQIGFFVTLPAFVGLLFNASLFSLSSKAEEEKAKEASRYLEILESSRTELKVKISC